MRIAPLVLTLVLACGKGAAPRSGASGALDTSIDCDVGGFMEPNVVPTKKLNRRYGSTATHFSELNTSQEVPVEVCGAKEQVAALLRYQCDDGSNPFSGFSDAHAARVGNTGPGGRCGMIIDLYKVPCPEQEYEVFMDLYSCPPGQSNY